MKTGFCANAIYNGGAVAPAGDCSTACPGNSAQKCGAGNRLTVYSLGQPQVATAPAGPGPQTSNLPTGWKYVGCLQ